MFLQTGLPPKVNQTIHPNQFSHGRLAPAMGYKMEPFCGKGYRYYSLRICLAAFVFYIWYG